MTNLFWWNGFNWPFKKNNFQEDLIRPCLNFFSSYNSEAHRFSSSIDINDFKKNWLKLNPYQYFKEYRTVYQSNLPKEKKNWMKVYAKKKAKSDDGLATNDLHK